MSSFLTFLFGGLSASGLAVGFFKWYTRRRERRRAEAVGSQISIKDGVENDLRGAVVILKSWTGTPLLVRRVCLLWPPTKAITLWSREETWYPSLQSKDFQRCHKPPQEILIDVGKQGQISARLKTTPFMKKLPLFLSRVYVQVTVETVDAQRRWIRFRLRSSRVDWNRMPQE